MFINNKVYVWVGFVEHMYVCIDMTSCIRGHHVYKNVWTPTLRDELECRKERDNDFDRYAVAVLRRSVVV